MDDLEKLFSEYRESLPDPEPSAAFTPGVWRRIEARRSPIPFLRRTAEAFVALAAVFTLLIGTFLIPRIQNASVYTANYIDVLAAEHNNNETLDFPETARADVNEAAPR
ncbi:MAG: hypothetical protein JSU00_18305 [Acidobacteria bacterium]|nr:hypothetical protein [Acidobacteriota bacterium]